MKYVFVVGSFLYTRYYLEIKLSNSLFYISKKVLFQSVQWVSFCYTIASSKTVK